MTWRHDVYVTSLHTNHNEQPERAHGVTNNNVIITPERRRDVVLT